MVAPAVLSSAGEDDKSLQLHVWSQIQTCYHVPEKQTDSSEMITYSHLDRGHQGQCGSPVVAARGGG